MIEIPHTGLRVEDGEHIAITGPGGCGKTRLAEAIAGYYPSRVKYMAFMDSYGLSSDRAYYLQQRWNSTEFDEDALTARQVLETLVRNDAERSNLERLSAMLDLDGVLDKDPITFSSGELRKYQIVKALLRSPEVLLIDGPFIGLDPAMRKILADYLEQLSREMTIVLILSRPEEIPDFITHVVIPGEKPQKIARQEYLESVFPPEIIAFHNVTIRYGDRTILRDLTWTVRQGEHWALTGANGSGKSTLLSLVCADNPMAYACDIRMFGHRRGSGESIWDIKKHIGYVSPEMHRSYKRNQPAVDVVASGLFDTTGLLHHITDEQRDVCRRWMGIFGIEELAGVEFNHLSGTQQRLCLVCRAFVKEPSLLILDEPLHGLDNPGRRKVRDIIDSYCSDPSKTLIMVTHYPEEYPSCIDHSLTLIRQK